MPEIPQVSIIVLNYNGEKVIEETLRALTRLNTPSNVYEVIIVDNNSQDNGRKYIDKFVELHSNFIKLYLKKNKGFAGGNNEGISIARGKYVILLNNDCIVEKNWLNELLVMANSDDEIFAISSKLMLYAYFVLIPIEDSVVKVELVKGDLLRFGKEKSINLPIIEKDFKRYAEVAFTKLDSNVILLVHNNKGRSKHKNITVSRKSNYTYQKIQNAGSVIYPDGYGRDIGASVTNKTQDFEKDTGQYNKSREIFAVCGAACLLKKDILDRIGYLNDDSFMYYEDTELSERARLHGYKNYYCSKAIVRHLHAFSSREWSDFFIFHVEKGRLLHIIAHFPFAIVVGQISFFAYIACIRTVHAIITRQSASRTMVYIKVLLNIIFSLPSLMIKRFQSKYPKENRQKMFELLKNGYYLLH